MPSCILCHTTKCWHYRSDGRCQNCYDKWRYRNNIDGYRNRKIQGANKYQHENSERYKIQRNIYRSRIRSRVLKIISNGNIICENCGCDDERMLEINHKNGGGEIDRNKGGNHLYWQIIGGKRGLKEFNILCRVCNALDYLRRKFGIVPIQVIWKVNR